MDRRLQSRYTECDTMVAFICVIEHTCVHGYGTVLDELPIAAYRMDEWELLHQHKAVMKT